MLPFVLCNGLLEATKLAAPAWRALGYSDQWIAANDGSSQALDSHGVFQVGLRGQV